jgi:thiamine-monophosphate kinase
MCSALRLSDLGEFGLIGELAARGLAQGIGDDCAELPGGMVVTQDVLVEDVHFRRGRGSSRDLGYKAAAVNLSDLAAAGADPLALFFALGLPSDIDTAAVVELYEGVRETGVPVRGGDMSSSDRLFVCVTAVGHSDRVPGRAGAQPGDSVVVTGALGGSAAGLRVLEQGLTGFEELARLHLRPPFRLDAGKALAPVAHALIDLSDGIGSDALRVAERSGCLLEIDVDRLPLAPRLAEVGADPFWTMGEDYELLAALAPADVGAFPYPVVGRCQQGNGVRFVRHGVEVDISGWDHFR